MSPDPGRVMKDDYEWDVFLSYERENVGTWVDQLFYPNLKKWLNLSSKRPIRIFYDQDIKPPANWVEKVSRGILRSRCMVSILTPQYFTTSEWCRAEWRNMRSREKKYGLWSKNKPDEGLIYGLIFQSPEDLPAESKRRQLADFSAWNVEGRYFDNTVEYRNFIDAVKKLAKLIVSSIPKAPPFDPTWKATLPKVTTNYKIEKPTLK